MELFIALFGGLYLLFRCLSEPNPKQYRKKMEEDLKAVRAELNEWVGVVVDDELEARCKKAAQFFVHPNKGVREILVKDIDHDIKDAFDGLSIEIKKLIEGDADLTLIAIMAMYGKLPYDIAAKGFICNPHNGVRANFKKDEERWWRIHDFFILIDKVLKDHMKSFNYRPLRCTYAIYKGDPGYVDNLDGIKNIIEMQDPKEITSPRRIAYFWAPARNRACIHI